MQMLKVSLAPGRYVAAVSGGVDSMVLLDLVVNQPGVEVTVAHFQHGMRPPDQTVVDKTLVRAAAELYGVQLVTDEATLGPNASEEAARIARYSFLLRTMRETGSGAILLAHHQDDVLETMILNVLRGTGWRGLSSLRSHHLLNRPLLSYDKAALLAYAREHQLQWHEDSTNRDEHYLRNYIRHTLLPRMLATQPAARGQYVQLYHAQCRLLAAIERETLALLSRTVTFYGDGTAKLPRYDMIMWPERAALELFQELWYQLHGSRLLTAQAQAALLFARSARPGKELRFGPSRLVVTRTHLIVIGGKK